MNNNDKKNFKINSNFNPVATKRPLPSTTLAEKLKSVRKAILQWLVFARRQETRQKRITEIAEIAEQKQKPKQF